MRLRTIGFVFATVAVLIGARAPGIARAESPAASSDASASNDAEEARALFERGVRFSAQGRWEEAEASFAESYERVPTVNCLLNLAVARFQLRRPIGGLAALDRVQQSPEVTDEQRDRANAMRQRLEAQVAILIVRPKPAWAEIKIDDHAVGRASMQRVRLDPGMHAVTVSAVGYIATTRSIALDPGLTASLDVELVPVAPENERDLATAPAPDAKPSRSIVSSPWFWGGVGAVVIGAGVTAFVLASRSHADPAGLGGSEGTTLKAR